MKRLLYLSLFLLATPTFGQSDAFRFLQEKYPDAGSKFLYQSVLRAFNVDNNADFNALISTIDKASVLFLGDTFSELEGESEEEGKRDKYKDIKLEDSDLNDVFSLLKEEDFIEMMTFQSDGQNISVYNEDHESPKHYVVVIARNESLIMADLKGEIDLNALMKLRTANPEIFKSLLTGKGLF